MFAHHLTAPLAPGAVLAVVAAVLSACGGAPAAGPAARVVISLQDITCQSCGMEVVDKLRARPGVHTAAFDKTNVEVLVTFDQAAVLPGDLLKAVRAAGYGANIGAGQGRYAPPESFDPALDVRWINKDGEAVEVAAQLVPAKVTVVDFGAKWCGPCREVDAAMKVELGQNPRLALRKVDVADWDSPVAKKYLGQVEGLPYVLVFAPDGRQVAAIAGLDLDKLRKAIVEAGKP
ncbi:MAG: thioredoxin family protein [Myxococcales bacterium]|nr:thioredoxin family protein [Myxococcales bacterium]